jgi:hypothetical protein
MRNLICYIKHVLARWFGRGQTETGLALYINPPEIMALHDRVAELELLLAANVIELDAYRAIKADKPVKAKSAPKAKAAAKTAKLPKLSALAFWALHGQAVEKIRGEFGECWKAAAPIGKTELATLATCYRSAKTERGTILRWGKDQRLPAAQYWPGGVFPEGVTIEPDYPRADPVHAGAVWRAGQTGKAAPKPFEHDAAWHLAHGYVLSGKVWISGLLHRSQLAHEEGIILEREAKRVAALELACLSYGPQPFLECDTLADIAA